jgi:hypothetical protein
MEDFALWGCCAAFACKLLPTFRDNTILCSAYTVSLRVVLLTVFEYWIASCSLYYVASRYISSFGTHSLCALCQVTFLCRRDVFRLRRVLCFCFASILFRRVHSQCFGCVTKGFFARNFKSDWHTLKFLALEDFVSFHCIPPCFVCCTNNKSLVTMVSRTSLPP